MSEDTQEIEAEVNVDKPEDESGNDFSISDVINNFLHRVMDVEDCAREFISTARKNFNSNADRLKEELTECQTLIEGETDQEKKLAVVREIRRCIREIDRHNNSAPADILEKSLFISLFSSFDKYIGDLIAVLYKRNPELYKNLAREIPLNEVLQYNSIEELRAVVLDKEIETIRRKSYSFQFSDLEKRFSITLKKFDRWTDFIEASQRRNLFTHCDGVVSKQYIEACNSVNYKFKETPEVGSQLEIGSSYFYETCDMLTEVAVMLGQTLWRKLEPEDLDSADTNLSRLIFDFLHMEEWKKSISLSIFALDLPKISDDQMERIFTVNYAIALKAIDKSSAAKKVLDRKDWSACSFDFRLAHSVICDEYEKAGELMNRLGKEGELITEMAYHDWPLFRDFRDRPEFFENYEKVYGYKYSSKLKLLAEEKKSETKMVEEDEELA
ncbi:hypothetical protein [Pseudoalteromonas piscicida]|uniref:hypothetical protein n=1 Tax=Pseudoalteromonas piscicida TaxID=43662 RepID=UPI0032C173C2